MTPEVLDSFRRGEAGAVAEMYREFGRMVYAVAYRVLGRRELAEEATQQTFVQAWRAAERIDVRRDPAPWLATIARRVAIDVYRYEACRPTSALDDADGLDRVAASPPPDIDVLDAVWQVRRAIDALAPNEGEIVRLQHLDGMTHVEIARKLGIALGTVKSRSHRAHRLLAAQLESLRLTPSIASPCQ
jgi:RNA polymerase sigma factor (sigma-70 family)